MFEEPEARSMCDCLQQQTSQTGRLLSTASQSAHTPQTLAWFLQRYILSMTLITSTPGMEIEQQSWDFVLNNQSASPSPALGRLPFLADLAAADHKLYNSQASGSATAWEAATQQ
jgi:hypothetical protein